MMLRLPIGAHLWWIAAFFAPDFFAVGYLINRRAGAFTYNFAHSKLTALPLLLTGLLTNQAYVLFTGLLVFGHSCFDRALGYGLKYPDSPDHTHLGLVGKARRRQIQGSLEPES